MTKPTLKKMLQAGRKGTTSSTRPKVIVLAGRERGHRMPKDYILHMYITKNGSLEFMVKNFFPVNHTHSLNQQRILKLNRDVALWTHRGGHDTIFIIKCKSREANMYCISSTVSVRWLCSLTSFSGCPASIRLGLSSLSGRTRAAAATPSSNQWLT